jgi:hypothetical protein
MLVLADTYLMSVEIQDCLVYLLPTVVGLVSLVWKFWDWVFFWLRGLSAVWSAMLKMYQKTFRN